jgi:hypothetical protein
MPLLFVAGLLQAAELEHPLWLLGADVPGGGHVLDVRAG